MKWRPLCSQETFNLPPVGRLIAFEHAVWRVNHVHELCLAEFSEADIASWEEAGRPDIAKWRRRPYRVDADFIAGRLPNLIAARRPSYHMDVSADSPRHWHVYPDSDRWPQCWCCGEPMPCRAQLEDDVVKKAAAKLNRAAARKPGSCWACGEAITMPGDAVSYPGPNLDFPGGIDVRFHVRPECHHSSVLYEARWLAADPRRERILTYPNCRGTLVVHADGSSECRDWDGDPRWGSQSEPGCRGHETHDHGSLTSCGPSCSRDCDPERHQGCIPTPRPPRRGQGTLL